MAVSKVTFSCQGKTLREFTDVFGPLWPAVTLVGADDQVSLVLSHIAAQPTSNEAAGLPRSNTAQVIHDETSKIIEHVVASNK
eukprot:TRINITY_DN1327_c0_g1_i1.p1 TRINITY_DN1327_c0_g1~~TRINITY_DN1327_c0_g1_i1.p1  ORF type:complete len:83 (-),score=8.70 TRINITY_DN1327_c0_g1_i1:104-352(-)